MFHVKLDLTKTLFHVKRISFERIAILTEIHSNGEVVRTDAPCSANRVSSSTRGCKGCLGTLCTVCVGTGHLSYELGPWGLPFSGAFRHDNSFGFANQRIFIGILSCAFQQIEGGFTAQKPSHRPTGRNSHSAFAPPTSRVRAAE